MLMSLTQSLGFILTNQIEKDEDHLNCVSTKVKEFEDLFATNGGKEDTADKPSRLTTISYKNIVTGDSSRNLGSSRDDEMDFQDTDDVSQVIRVEEKWIAGYECPEFILSELEERCIAKPWEQGVIIKMLKRSIGYRALENRLQVMWAKWGFLNIIDLGQEFYLVTFTNQEDQALALLEGSWLI